MRWLLITGVIVPGGTVLLAVAGVLWLFRCRHVHEIWRRIPDGVMGLECLRCGHWHPATVLYPPSGHGPRLTQPVEPPPVDPLPELERLARRDRGVATARARFGGQR